MKKTYRTFNGENRECFIKIGEEIVKARFTPTYTTDNEFVQETIEESYLFKAGEVQIVEQLQWKPIDRDENGFVTEECLDKMFSHLPMVLHHNKMGGGYDVLNPQTESLKLYFREGVKTSEAYTHYLPIPKLEV